MREENKEEVGREGVDFSRGDFSRGGEGEISHEEGREEFSVRGFLEWGIFREVGRVLGGGRWCFGWGEAVEDGGGVLLEDLDIGCAVGGVCDEG